MARQRTVRKQRRDTAGKLTAPGVPAAPAAPLTQAAPLATWKLAVVLVVGLTAVALALLHVKGTNGAWYYPWHWRRLSWIGYPLTFTAATPLLVGQWLYARKRIGAWSAIAMAASSVFLLQLAITTVQPPGWGRITKAIEDPTNTSYYTVAVLMNRQLDRSALGVGALLSVYPQIMDSLMLHASYKPPGWVLYYIMMISLFGEGSGAAVPGALGVAVLAAMAVPMTYALMRAFELDEGAAMAAACFFALTPSLILFFPQGDQAYPALSCGMLIAWRAALHSNSRRGWWLAAAVFGALLAVGLFFSAIFLMLGVFLAIYTMLFAGDGGWRGLRRAAEASLVAVGTLCILYLLLWLASGFDPIETFFTAARRNQAGTAALARPWPLHSALDVVDIALGLAWICVPLIAMGARAAWREWDWHRPQFRLVFLGLLQMAMAVAVALFPGENARLMLPLMPLLMAPIGLELSRWPARTRIVVYVLLVLILSAYNQNMVFLNVDPNYVFKLNG